MENTITNNEFENISLDTYVTPCTHLNDENGCKYGSKCRFKHPKCHLGVKCHKKLCKFSHKECQCPKFPNCPYGKGCSFAHTKESNVYDVVKKLITAESEKIKKDAGIVRQDNSVIGKCKVCMTIYNRELSVECPSCYLNIIQVGK